MMKFIDKNDSLFWSVYHRLKSLKADDKHYKVLSRIVKDKYMYTAYKCIFGTVWILLEDTDKDTPLCLMRK